MARRTLEPAREQEIVAALVEGGSPTGSYFVLLVLSTLIATFGLVSNSTATVIGAMIVAPLMGPILALALGLVRGDVALVRRSGGAEIVGVVAVLLVSALLGLLLGPENLDYAGSELQGRIRPTLYDMGIGFSAGLAAGFAMVNSRVSASIAGVAIAVALVPPLCVSGLFLAGAATGHAEAASAGQAFTLFLANFVTIEVGAGLVFALFGLGHVDRLLGDRTVRRGLWLNLALLASLGVFLSLQLRELVTERFYRQVSREYLAAQVPRMIPGGSLEDLAVRVRGRRVEIRLATRAPQAFTASMSEELAAGLRQRLQLGEDQELDLLVGTGLYEFVSPQGRLFVAGDPEEERNRSLERSLREALAGYPAAELVQWSRPDAARPEALHLTVRSPYVFDAPLVAELQARVRELAGQDGLGLTVRTTVGQDFTADGAVEPPRLDRQAWAPPREQARALLQARVAAVAGASLLEVEVRERPTPPGEEGEPAPTPVFPAPPRPLAILARVQSPEPLPAARIEGWRRDLEAELGAPTWLRVDNPLGRSLEASPVRPAPPGGRPGGGARPGGSRGG